MANANHLRIVCPHCGQGAIVGLDVQAIQTQRRGPAPYDPGPEVDAYVIEKIEKGLSLRAVAELLEEKDIPMANGSKKWHATSVRSLYEHALARRAQTTN